MTTIPHAKLALRLAAHADVPWLPGMRTRTVRDGRAWRLRDHGGRPEPMLEAGPRLRYDESPANLRWHLPDLTDPATVGLLMHLCLEESFGLPEDLTGPGVAQHLLTSWGEGATVQTVCGPVLADRT